MLQSQSFVTSQPRKALLLLVLAHHRLYTHGMNVLRRIWTGIVAALAGAVLSVLLQMLGQMTVGLSVDYLPRTLLACAGGGFLVGVLLRPPSAKPGAKEQSGSIMP